MPSLLQREIDDIRLKLRTRKVAKQLLSKRDELKSQLDIEEGRGSLKDSTLIKKIDKYLFK